MLIFHSQTNNSQFAFFIFVNGLLQDLIHCHNIEPFGYSLDNISAISKVSKCIYYLCLTSFISATYSGTHFLYSCKLTVWNYVNMGRTFSLALFTSDLLCLSNIVANWYSECLNLFLKVWLIEALILVKKTPFHVLIIYPAQGWILLGKHREGYLKYNFPGNLIFFPVLKGNMLISCLKSLYPVDNCKRVG